MKHVTNRIQLRKSPAVQNRSVPCDERWAMRIGCATDSGNNHSILGLLWPTIAHYLLGKAITVLPIISATLNILPAFAW